MTPFCDYNINGELPMTPFRDYDINGEHLNWDNLLTKKHSFLNLSSIEETMSIMWDFAMPSIFPTDKSHSIPVPQSVTFNTGTLADRIGCTFVTCFFSANTGRNLIKL